MYIPSNWLTGMVGRRFARTVKAFPIVFLLICLVGLAIGVSALFLFWEQPSSPRGTWIVRGIGVGCLVFYGWLLLLFAIKVCRHTWGEFCDRMYGRFENM